MLNVRLQQFEEEAGLMKDVFLSRRWLDVEMLLK